MSVFLLCLEALAPLDLDLLRCDLDHLKKLLNHDFLLLFLGLVTSGGCEGSTLSEWVVGRLVVTPLASPLDSIPFVVVVVLDWSSKDVSSRKAAENSFVNVLSCTPLATVFRRLKLLTRSRKADAHCLASSLQNVSHADELLVVVWFASVTRLILCKITLATPTNCVYTVNQLSEKTVLHCTCTS